MATSDIKINAQNPIASTEAITALVKKINEQFKQDEFTELSYSEWTSGFSSGTLEPGHLYKINATRNNLSSLPEDTSYIVVTPLARSMGGSIVSYAYNGSSKMIAIGIPSNGLVPTNCTWIDVEFANMSIPVNDVTNALAGNGSLTTAPPVVH